MLWDELYVDIALEPDRVRSGAAVALAIPGERVVVVQDIGAAKPPKPGQVTIELRTWPGPFARRLGLYFESGATPPKDKARARARLLETLECRALTSDDSVDPYRFVLLHGDGRTEPVIVDPTALDERNELVISERLLPNLGQSASKKSLESELSFYRERSTMLFPKTPAQESSIGALDRLIADLVRSGAAPVDRIKQLKEASTAVRKAWPAELCAQTGSSVHSLLRAAELIAQGALR
jgi:hypothetical protein